MNIRFHGKSGSRAQKRNFFQIPGGRRPAKGASTKRPVFAGEHYFAFH
jgi:hypothetical protein